MLSGYLECLSTKELYQLDYAHLFQFLPRNGSVHMTSALAEILNNLKATKPHRKRLSYVARLYCLLMPCNCFGPWRLYRLNVFAVQFKFFTLHRRFAAAMHYPGSEMTFVPKVYPDGRSACIVTTEPMSGLRENSVLCLSVFNGLPYVAVWAGRTVNLERLHCALVSVLRNNPQQCLVSTYPTLSASLAAARRLFDMESKYPPLKDVSAALDLLAYV